MRMVIDDVPQVSGWSGEVAEATPAAAGVAISSPGSMFEGLAFAESDGPGPMGESIATGPASEEWMSAVLSAASALMVARLMVDPQSLPLATESSALDVSQDSPVVSDLPVDDSGTKPPADWSERVADVMRSATVAWTGSASSTIESSVFGNATGRVSRGEPADVADGPASIRVRWGSTIAREAADHEGPAISATDNSDSSNASGLNALVDAARSAYLDAGTTPTAAFLSALVVASSEVALSAPAAPIASTAAKGTASILTPTLSFDTPVVTPGSTNSHNETPVDRAWLQARERALIAVRQDFNASRDRALASAASGPATADPAWHVSMVTDGEGRSLIAADVPLSHWVDPTAAPVLTSGDAEGSQAQPGVWLAFDEESFAKSYQAQSGAALQALAALYRTDVPSLLQLPDLWRISITDHAINAGPGLPGVAMGDATQLHTLDLYLADPEIQALITQFGGTPEPATSTLAQEQVRLYGQHRFDQLSLLGVAMQSVRDQYVGALLEARANGGAGSSQQPRTREAFDESGRIVTQTLVATGLRDEEGPASEWRSDGQGTPVMESVFDLDVFTAWYKQQAGLAHRAFASFYGRTHSSTDIAPNGSDGGSEGGTGIETRVTRGQFDNAHWTLRLTDRGCTMDHAELVAVDLNSPPDLHDETAVGFDPEAGWVTSVANLDEGFDWLQAVATIIVVAIVAYASAGAGSALAESAGLTTTVSEATVGTSALIGGMAVASGFVGATTSIAAGIMNGNLSLKGVLQGTLSGALTGAAMAAFGPMVTTATSTTALTAEGVVSTVPTAVTGIANIALRSTVQGAVELLMGGKFEHGALVGLAGALGQNVTAGLLDGIDAAVDGQFMSASLAPAAKAFARVFGAAVVALASPDDSLRAFANSFVQGVLHQMDNPGVNPKLGAGTTASPRVDPDTGEHIVIGAPVAIDNSPDTTAIIGAFGNVTAPDRSDDVQLADTAGGPRYPSPWRNATWIGKLGSLQIRDIAPGMWEERPAVEFPKVTVSAPALPKVDLTGSEVDASTLYRQGLGDIRVTTSPIVQPVAPPLLDTGTAEGVGGDAGAIADPFPGPGPIEFQPLPGAQAGEGSADITAALAALGRVLTADELAVAAARLAWALLEKVTLGAGLMLAMPNQQEQIELLNATQRFVTRTGELYGKLEQIDAAGKWVVVRDNVRLYSDGNLRVALTDEELRTLTRPITTPMPPPIGPTITVSPPLADGVREAVELPTTTPSDALPPITVPGLSGAPALTIHDLILQSKAEAQEAYRKNPGLRSPASLIGNTDGGPGAWDYSSTRVQRGKDYQEALTNVPRGIEYQVNGVWFDGYDPSTNTLVDTKDWVSYPPLKATFWEEKTLHEASRQVAAARGTGNTVEWQVSTTAAAEKIKTLFEDRDLQREYGEINEIKIRVVKRP